MAEVVLKNIGKKFDDHQVINNLNLLIGDGEFVTLLGPSGCGKTTLLRMIAGLETVDNGDLIVGGKRYNDIPPRERRIAMVFQSYALFPHMTVRANILFGLKIQKVSPTRMQEKLEWVIAMLGLQDLEDRLPKEISGGQRQRVALARALVLDPDVLLLDEPLSNLDAALREMAMEELKRIHRQVGKTIIYVTHNQVEAMTMSERIALLSGGELEQYDEPRYVYDRPETMFSAQFIGSPAINFIDGVIAQKENQIGIDSRIGFLLLDKERFGRAGEFTGRKVKVGIRPQNISYLEHRAARRYSDTSLTITVELIESLGDRSLIVGKVSDEITVRFLITREADIALDQEVRIFIDGRRLHLFDPRTQKNIFAARRKTSGE
ncbi:MAG: ATP-binding cassette domain-containing protein [Chitinivibrionales bacterium]|nr:ATP-binding cassette domain-containing protein [Chitinivibrionales bacterium]